MRRRRRGRTQKPLSRATSELSLSFLPCWLAGFLFPCLLACWPTHPTQHNPCPIPPPTQPPSWSALSRRDRYIARATAAATAAGDPAAVAVATAAAAASEDNPLPHHVDPITLEPVVAPAISPFGHVMGMATWRAVLSEGRRCPFTKQPLRTEQLVALNRNNIERYRAAIVKL